MHITRANYEEYKTAGRIDEPIVCGNRITPILFFFSYTILVSFVVLNLFIAVIFEGFDESQKSQKQTLADLIQRCINEWPEFDKDYCMILPLSSACEFLTRVCPKSCPIPNLTAETVKEEMTGKKEEGKEGNNKYHHQPFIEYNCDLNTAQVIRLRITSDYKVHFSSCVKAIMRWVAVNEVKEAQHFSALKQALKLIESAERAEKSEIGEAEKARRKCNYAHKWKLPEETFSVEEGVAATRIQKAFKKKVMYKNQRKKEKGMVESSSEQNNNSVNNNNITTNGI